MFKSIFFLSVFCVLTVVAQTQTGTITGKVTDGESGEPMRSATVQVLNTKKGAYSDTKGRFTIKNVPVGEYQVQVRFIGYASQTVPNVIVKSGEATTVNVVLHFDKKNQKQVVVEGRKNSESQDAVLVQRKNATNVSDGVSAEEMKRLPDSDAGQALKRVSGVTVVGDKYVYVRGVSERYNNTTLNGASLTSTEPDKKAFSFDMFPSDLLESANVIKSFTADLPGNFAGGLVQLKTIDFPDGYSVRVGTSFAGSDNLLFSKNSFEGYSGGASDRWAMDDGTRALPSSMPGNRSEMNTLLSSARSYYAGNVTEATKAAAERWESLGKSFNSSVWNKTTPTVAPAGSFSVTASNLYRFEENELGLIASLSYGNTYSLSKTERAGLSSTGDYLMKANGTENNHSVNWNALVNLAFALDRNNTFSFKNVYNQSADDQVITSNATNFAQGRDKMLYGAWYVQRTLQTSQLLGEHTLSGLSNLLVNWRLGYSRSLRDEPDFRRLSFSRSMGTEEQYILDVSTLQQGDGTSAGRFYSHLTETGLSGATDFTLPVDDMKIKFGGLYEQKDRSFSARSFTFIQSRVISRGEVLSDSVLALTPQQIFAADNYGANGLGISEDSKPTDAYNAMERLSAGYAMIDMPVSFLSDNVRFVGGVRVEHNQQNLTSPYSFKTGTNIADSSIVTDLVTTDVLPSINLIYKVNAESNLRVSASQTLTRPTLREFAPFSFYDFQSLSVVRGNPRLNRALIQNYDVRYEYFPARGEVLSANVFYKRFQNAIEETIVPVASEVERSFSNANGIATNYGIELEARKHLAFIDSTLEGLVANVNVAFINSSITVQQGAVSDTRQMWGQSPYTVNVGLYYMVPSWGTTFNLGYNVIGKRIVKVAQQGVFEFSDPHVYELPRDVVDISISQQLLESLDLRLAFRDILNQPLRWQQGGQTVSSEVRGRNMNCSLSYRFK
ncbi:MAG: carboxypeptidase regulatory-like domain-containing protein [Candidatus Kapaibacterium sp.]|nr:carboxypeptidase regulatory-like domain-containing protein [Bacteroidota bacterium]